MARQQASIAGQESAYRRGMVLGLTMAEILALALFVLMLLLVALQYEHEDVVAEKNESIEILSKQNESMSTVVSNFESLAEGKQISDFFKELAIAEAAAKQIPALIVEKDSLFEQLQEITGILNENGIETADKEALKKELELRDELVAALENQGHPLDPEKLEQTLDQFQQLVEETSNSDGQSIVEIKDALDAKERENDRLKGQLANTRNKLAATGKGNDPPPCWADENGKQQYIFDIAATSNGMKIREHYIEERVEDRKDLPLSEVVFQNEISPEAFLNMMKPVFNWSVKNDCRFWVLIYDHTGPTEKEVWQVRDRQIADRFYRNTIVRKEDWPK